MALALLGEIHLGLGNLDRAETYARQVIDMEHTSCLPDGLRTLGEVKMHQGDLKTAEQLIRQSLEIAQSNQDRILQAYALRALGNLCNRSGMVDDAARNFEKSVSIFRDLGLAVEINEMPPTTTSLHRAPISHGFHTAQATQLVDHPARPSI